ncbi:DNA mismatch repair protein MutS, partial [Mrakia frigida]|uniref:MutS family protein MSH5 n=1 Tax=Mrakia frigida TaxID=29902 RepID=UPI003FCBFBE3
SKQTTMCIYSVKAKLAASYLEGTNLKLWIMEDVYDTDHFDIAEMVLDQVKPDLVLVNANAEDALVDKIKAYGLKEDKTVEIRPQKEFNYNKSKNRIISLRLPPPSSFHRHPPPSSNGSVASSSNSRSQSNNAYDFQRRAERVEDMNDDQRSKTAEMRLSGMIDFEKGYSICAAGGLLSHHSRARARGELPGGDDGALSVHGIEIFTPEAYMQINADTLSSLQIFDEESHAYMHSGATREGLSLFGILNNTRTPTGKQLLRTWLLRPLLSIKEIAARHDAVALFARQENHVPVQNIEGLLKGVKNVVQVLGRLRRGTAGVRDWKVLLEFSYRCVQIKDGAADLIGPHSTTMIKKLAATLDTDVLTTLGQQINDTVDWEDSIAENRVCCKDKVDPELDEWKRMYAGLGKLLSRSTSSVADDLQVNVPDTIVSSLNVTYFPQLGFLIAAGMVEPWNQETQDDEVLEGWVFQFATAAVVYFKDARMRDLDAHFGDIHSNIVDREIEIAYKLSEIVLGEADSLQEAASLCDELDCLISFANAAKSFEYTRPLMTEENSIIIKNGRHPLQELTVESFVPNSTKLYGGRGIIPSMSDDEDEKKRKQSVLVLTGSNQSGKSVYGKGVALIVYMAQIGCFVPCEAATIGLCDKIFTRLSSKESVAKARLFRPPQSSFMIDLSQISYALRNATPRSLLIADEFGKGTISTDGAGLLAGVIMHLLNRGDRCPKFIAMTHFHELFTNDLLSDSLPIFFASMEPIPLSPNPLRTSTRRSTLYFSLLNIDVLISHLSLVRRRLVPNLSLTSHAAACARSQGIPHEVVERSVEVGALISRFEFLPLQNRQLSEEEKDDLAYSERICRNFLAADFSDEFLAKGKDVKTELAKLL